MRTKIKLVSQELNLPEEVVLEAYRSFYEFVRTTIQELPLGEMLSEEEFNKLKCNFNLPSLGKLYVTYDIYLGVKKRLEYINKIKERLNKEE